MRETEEDEGNISNTKDKRDPGTLEKMNSKANYQEYSEHIELNKDKKQMKNETISHKGEYNIEKLDSEDKKVEIM